MKISVEHLRASGHHADTDDPLSIVRAARAAVVIRLEDVMAWKSSAEDELARATAANDEAVRALRDIDAWLAAQELQR